MIQVANVIRKQPYLSFNEQQALEDIVLKIISSYPMISKIILYGSKARGGFTEDSDIDLLFITDHALSRAQKFEIYDAIFEAEVEHDVVVSAVFVSAQDIETRSTPFLKRVQDEGSALWSRE